MITIFPSGEFFVKCRCSNCGGEIFWNQIGKPSKKDLLRHNFYQDEDICRMCHILKNVVSNKNKDECDFKRKENNNDLSKL